MSVNIRKANWVLALALLASMAFAEKDRTSSNDIGSGRPPANAFCQVTPHTTNQLVNQVRLKSDVMDRYKRHFAMTDEEVVAFLGTLQPGQLASDGEYTVYGVPRDGKLHFHRRVLKRGEKVFMDSTGRAILQMRCGNPLTLGPQNPIALSSTPEPGTPVDVVETPVPQPEQVLPEPEVSVPVVSYAPPVTPPGVEVPAIVSHGSNNGLLLLIPAVGLIAAGTSTHHNPPPVPEPASMAVLVMGAGALIAKRRKR